MVLIASLIAPFKSVNANALSKASQMVTDATLIEADAAIESVEKIDGLMPEEFEGQTVSKKTHESSTDPEASVVSRPGYKNRLYYKSHCTIDGSSRILTDCHVTIGSTHETTVFKERVDSQIQDLKIKPEEWLADSGYGQGSNYKFLQALRVTSYIPLRSKMGNGKTWTNTRL